MNRRKREAQQRSQQQRAGDRRLCPDICEQERAAAQHARRHHSHVTSFSLFGCMYPMRDAAGFYLRHLGLLDINRSAGREQFNLDHPPVITKHRKPHPEVAR
ncbi:hypothetical protein GCM10008955_00870 [Deinococcus malanensis]|uniref:Uncharacterized protein n=1 Tax=Deinococcus malanensis TaxID=1706855 RepID=A0ABQ2EJ54_9DEIO|nr:hypothetical protein [Deinococcus malanensis]GGK11461.1 hypothetical protein GCM10008955_00870 [Deinococcus malanensis]